MAATYPLTITAWNGLLSQINYLCEHPPEGCDSLTTLELVTVPHKWSTADIVAARDKLTEICSDNEFYAPSTGRWLNEIVDELWEAIDNGWCNCEPEIPCCIPQGSGTVWIEPGHYQVTIPYWQIVEQYLYGYVSYADAEAAFPDGVWARIIECYPGSSGFIAHSFHHLHWVNCVYRDKWLDGGWRGEEYWSTCETEPEEIDYLGRLPAIASSYGGSTNVGPTNYGSYPWTYQYHYDYIEGRWYETCQIGYFEVDAYWYTFAYWNLFSCPTDW
jgi:hypothetical protein